MAPVCTSAGLSQLPCGHRLSAVGGMCYPAASIGPEATARPVPVIMRDYRSTTRQSGIRPGRQVTAPEVVGPASNSLTTTLG